jgi:hypothetical protein
MSSYSDSSVIGNISRGFRVRPVINFPEKFTSCSAGHELWGAQNSDKPDYEDANVIEMELNTRR